MWDVIRGLVDGGTTLMLTTQYLEEADQLADRIVVVDGGRVIAEGTSDELKAKVGGELLDVTLAADASDRRGRAHPGRASRSGRSTSTPTPGTCRCRPAGRTGLVTEVVGALAAASIRVDALDVRRPSLDDVFIELTGHAAEPGDDGRRRGGRVSVSDVGRRPRPSERVTTAAAPRRRRTRLWRRGCAGR